MLHSSLARRVVAVAVPLALLATGCADDDGAGVRTIDGSGSASGSVSGSASGSGPASGSASGSASASGVTEEGVSGELGAYAPVSDVSGHARVTLDVCDIKELLPKDAAIDYDAVAAIYTDGANSGSGDDMRTLAGFATEERDEPLWNQYVDRFGATWLDDFVSSAIDGTGGFEGEDDLVRRQAIEKGVQNQIMIAWALHEMDSARASIEEGDLDPASGAPHKVDEVWAFYHGTAPSCAPYGTAESRGEDFGTGDAANQAALEATEGMRDAAIEGDLEAYDAAYDKFLEAIKLTYTQATLKYAQNVTSDLAADDAEAARVHQAEGWAFYRVLAPFVAEVDPAADDAISGVLDLANEPSADAGETVRTALEGVYDGLGLTAEEIGQYDG
jgi:hypothetical protein